MNKVISYCLFGNVKNKIPKHYTEGAIWNARNYKRFYPDWTARFYVQEGIDPILETLLSKHAEVHVYEPDCLNMYSIRFLPLMESNICIFRDVDSMITEREVKAVNEWLQSDKRYHAIKDHPFHYDQSFPVLAGLWGKKGVEENKIILKLIKNILDIPYHYIDQDWIRDFIWNKNKDKFMIHSLAENTEFSDGWTEENYCGRRAFQ